jgi:hypothetical protein
MKAGQLRMPDLRHTGANNPLVLRTKSAPEQRTASRAGNHSQAFQS